MKENSFSRQYLSWTAGRKAILALSIELSHVFRISSSILVHNVLGINRR